MNEIEGPGLRRAVWTALPAAAAFAWAATSLRPFTGPALAVTLLTGVCILAIGTRLPPADAGGRVLGLGAARGWLAVVLALAAWEWTAFVQLPRAENPTLSSLANEVFDSHLIRTACFMLWMAAGLGIARR